MNTLRILILALVTLSARAAEPPNIVFIIADDLGWGDVTFHGGNAPTPNLERLRTESLELTQHYVYPVCSPTRAALLSGRYATRFGVTTPQNPRAYPWGTVTLASALKSVGYDTALCGKWHLGSRPEWGPQKFGFDHSYGSLAGGVGPWDHRYKQGEFTTTWHRDGQLIEEQGHVTDLITREAVQWIESRTAKPFFLYVPFTAVHLPIKEPGEWLAKVPAEITGDVARQYAACVMHLDDSVGRIAAAVEKTGRASNTLFIFTSDNGGSWAENADNTYPPDDYAAGKLTASNGPLRDQKGSVYEGGIRVPCLVRWPGKLQPGKFPGVVHVTDWMPTFCALAGYQPAGDLKWDGLNILPQLTGAEPPKARAIYIAAPNFRTRAIREGDWKLIVPDATRKASAEKTELFNIATDPNESTDLAAKEPQRVEAMRARLAELSKADRDAVADD
jgi:arylsulfatase A-like enzyme